MLGHGAMILGAVVAAGVTWGSDHRLTRGRFALYLFPLLLTGLGLSLLLPSSLSASMALTAIWAAIFGFLLWWIASARCRDAYGNVYVAAAAFIPALAVFLGAMIFLLFKGSRASDLDEWDENLVSDDAHSTRSRLKSGLMVAGGLAVAGAALFVAQILGAASALDEQMSRTSDNISSVALENNIE